MKHEFKSGDIILTAGDAWISKLIRWATRYRGEKRTIKNHVGIGVDDKYYVEALWTTKRNKYEDLLKQNKKLEIWRNVNLDDEEAYILKLKALEYVGSIYGPHKILLHFLDALLEKLFGKNIYLFRRIGFINRFPICSWVVSFVYSEINYSFGIDKRFATPDCIHDYLVKNNNWKLVYSNHVQKYTENKYL